MRDGSRSAIQTRHRFSTAANRLVCTRTASLYAMVVTFLPWNAKIGVRRAHRRPRQMIIEVHASAPFFKNGFVLGCEETHEGVIVDPGDEVGLLLAAVEQHRLSIQYILLTHAHLDHITGVARAKRALNVPVV